MMRALARYAQANAVLRANLSNLLSRNDFETLARADSAASAWSLLRDTPYAERLPDQPLVDPLAIDRSLRDASARMFRHVLRPLSGAPRAVGLQLLSRWELDDLEDCLREWHAKDEGLSALVPEGGLVNALPFQQIVTAERLDDNAVLLDRTPYGEPIRETLPVYKETHSLFRVEVALEKSHYQRLLAEVAKLGASDAEATRRIISSEIDLLNLAWLSRCATYEEVQPATLRELMIPNPSPLSRRIREAADSPEGLSALSDDVVPGRSGAEAKNKSSWARIGLLEALVVQSAAEEAAGYLAGFPFRFVAFLAFYFLLRIELRNLRMVFAGKAVGAAPDELVARLWTVR